MITFKHKGNFNNTERFLTRAQKADFYRTLDKYGQIGVSALASTTPIDTGLTASSWEYKVSHSGDRKYHYISWSNTHLVDNVSIAIILQYGHGTKSGTFVQGRDYINPAMWSLFDQIADGIWEEVINL